MSDTEKSKLIGALLAFINQRPGFDPSNYNTRSELAADYRRTVQSKADAIHLLRAVELAHSITVEDILSGMRGTRLSYVGGKIEYVTGQYFPTEYRSAVASTLFSVLRNYYASDDPWQEHEGAFEIHASLVGKKLKSMLGIGTYRRCVGR